MVEMSTNQKNLVPSVTGHTAEYSRPTNHPKAGSSKSVSKLLTFNHGAHKINKVEAALRESTHQAHPNITEIAKEHGCDRTTLSRRFRQVALSNNACTQ
jgi:transcriptional regulator of acetoin/glycerol metabolism